MNFQKGTIRYIKQAGEMIWLRIFAAFVIARLIRSLEISQTINRDICPQKNCLTLPTENIAVVLC